MGARPFTTRRPSAAAPAIEGPRPDSEPASRPFRRGREAAALLLFAVSCFICLALASYRLDPSDPTLSGADWVGPVGAFAAGVLVRGFGLVAWLAPLEVALIGLPLLRGKDIGSASLRIAGDLVMAIMLAALVRVAAPELLVFGRAPSGGNVGLVFGELGRGLFSAVGSFLVGGTVVGLILIGRSSFSFIAWCQRAMLLALGVFTRATGLGRRFGNAWSEAHKLRQEQRAAEKVALEPTITNHESDDAIIAQLVDDDVGIAPLDTTGTPPLAVSTALRSRSPMSAQAFLDSTARPAAKSAGLAAPTPAPPAVEKAETLEPPSPGLPLFETTDEPETPTAPKKPRGRAKPAELRIVDTLPEQAVKRGDGPSPRRISGWQFPPTSLLAAAGPSVGDVDKERILQNATLLEKTLADYGVTGKVEEIHPGPTVTTYEVVARGGHQGLARWRASPTISRSRSRARCASSRRFPGKNRIGFELPNDERIPVSLRELVEDRRFQRDERAAAGACSGATSSAPRLRRPRVDAARDRRRRDRRRQERRAQRDAHVAALPAHARRAAPAR